MFTFSPSCLKLLQAGLYLPCVSCLKSLCQPDSLYTETRLYIDERLPPRMTNSLWSVSGMEQALLSEKTHDLDVIFRCDSISRIAHVSLSVPPVLMIQIVQEKIPSSTL